MAIERSASASSTIGARSCPAMSMSSRTSSAVARPGAQARADDDRVVLVVEDPGERRLRVDLLDVVLGERHRRGLDHLGREQRLEGFGTASVTSPAPARPAARQTSSAAPA